MNDKICGYKLDCQQQDIVLDEHKYLLVVAGAGSGKTLTMLGKIYYLVKYKNIKPEEILCISFTKASCDSLRDKIEKELGMHMSVYTFHKLSLEILKQNNVFYNITSERTLHDVIEHFFAIDILGFPVYMKWVLQYFDIYNIHDIKLQYQDYVYKNRKQLESLCKLTSTFICLFKCNGYKLEDFSVFLKKAKKTIFYFRYRKEKIFLILALNIYIKYQDYLIENNEIDFNDMIVLATDYVDKKGINIKYKYIIIDEYQDTSLVRFKLIRSILQKTFSNLVTVGDDFQSIYRFTGCDISLFINFVSYFQGAVVKKIENTYRNSQELITVAGNFVMKNRCQIFKNLSSQKHLKKPIKIFYYQDMKKDFIYLLKKIGEINKKPIMILGRNNNDIYRLLSKRDKVFSDGRLFFFGFDNISAYYLTIHKSKGLEEENVIIINLVDDKLGFPNRISDDKILRFVSIKEERYPYAEERRLFYVALTRTKNNVYLFVPKKKDSVFVKELIKERRKMIEIINV